VTVNADGVAIMRGPADILVGITQEGTDRARAIDHAWFAAHPEATEYERPLMPGEGPPPDPGREGRVKADRRFDTRELTWPLIRKPALVGSVPLPPPPVFEGCLVLVRERG
jgi:hypothetical protein